MAVTEPQSSFDEGPPSQGRTGTEAGRRSRRTSPRHRTPLVYRVCDGLTEWLLYAMLLFSPWAYGTTQLWAIQIMNLAGYALGILLAIKWCTQWIGRYAPARWASIERNRWLTPLLAILTVILLGWTLASALNARAELAYEPLRLAYRENWLAWLPHSYHAPATWSAFWEYLALACGFWALRDWLLGKSRRERHGHMDEAAPAGKKDDDDESLSRIAPNFMAKYYLPVRLRRLLWVLCLNGGLLALEGIVQRLDGTSKVLWLVKARFTSGEGIFGPYAYRNNAAEYLNLISPLCLAFWWTLHARTKVVFQATARVGNSPHVVLLPCVVLMAAAPVIAAARGGALIAIGSLVAALMLVAFRGHAGDRRMRWSIGVLLALVGAVAGFLGWKPFSERWLVHRFSYPTHISRDLQDYTLRCRFQVPSSMPALYMTVVGLSDRTNVSVGYQIEIAPRAASILLHPYGSLDVFVAGEQVTNCLHKQVTNFVNLYGGYTLDLAMVKDTDVRVYANGELLPTIDLSPATLAATNRTAATYLVAGQAFPGQRIRYFPVLGAEVYDYALSTNEILALAKATRGDNSAGSGLTEAPPVARLTDAQLRARVAPLSQQLSGRREILETAHRMADDFCWLGSGPGTFGPLYGLYRSAPEENWAWYAHSDWLETRITFGRLGAFLVLCACAVALLCGRLSGAIEVPGVFAGCTWLALAGCLVHAWVDFPFQVYSVMFLFLVVCGIGSVVRPRS